MASPQVARRIGRGDANAYEVNGKAVLARDVQALFADLAGSARASAMVGQPIMAGVIAVCPEERLKLLEQASGPGGMHARWAEADGKLQAAASKVLRAADRHAVLKGN